MSARLETNRHAFLISGGGTTMAEMIRAIQSGKVPHTEVACVIASKASAGGIQKALALGIPSEKIAIIERKNFKGPDNKVDQTAFGQAIVAVLKANDVTTITQNGWLPLTPPNVITEYPDAIYNQHPGPLPEFGNIYGMQVHAAVLYFARQVDRAISTMAIAQRVAPIYDEGAVVLYETVPVNKDATAEELQQSVLPVEHALQVQLLKLIANGSVIETVSPKTVQPGEEQLLLRARQQALIDYPKG